jgi:membrane protease YdiL (CAAX protease family)
VLYNKEGLQSIGITKLNLMKSCILGILLGIIVFIACQYPSTTDNPAVNIISVAALISFIEFLIVGFAEEIIFRGYLQTRLIAWQGTVKGCLLTAFIFSFWHLPHNLILAGMNLQDAFFNCIRIFLLSLMLGYIMIRTKNITSVAILHTFINWTVN